MDESSEGASVGGFGIGPRTPLGRAVALRILVGGSLAELRGIAAAAAVRWAKAAWKLRRRPQVALVAVVALALWLRRRGAAVSAQTRARLAYRRKYWRNAMRGAVTYDEWAHAARMLEALTLTPRKDRDGELYDEELVRSRLRELVLRRQHGGVRHVIFCLRADLVRNLGNMCNPRLHKGRLQVPKLIKDYIEEVSTQLRMVCDWDSEELSLEEKLALMHETRHAFGRTALLLSGGSSLGAFHVGVVKTLVENRLLPRVVAGSSVGSVMCAIVGTRTWPDLQSFFVDTTPPLEFFDNLGGIFAVVRRVLSLGAVHETQQLQTLLRKLTSNMTFQEAFDLTGRVLGITICSPRRHEPPRLLNYLTSPHVVIWSAVTASCAFPGLFQAQELLAKDRSGELVPYHSPFQGGPDDSASGIRVRQWRDGSLESDLPMMQLKELFNVNHFIVSQANPHIAPLLRFKEFVRAYGGDFAAKLVHLVEMEVKHRCNQILELGFPMGGIAKLFAQEWEGDVTIVMPATLAQFAKIIQNPSPAELQKAIHQGRRCAWEKLSAIKANCGIELVLDECVSFLNHMRRVRRNAERAASQGIASVTRFSAGKRIPSWNCMERESSWGSLDEEALTSELAERPGGPWGGRSRRFLRAYSDASDSESENNVEFGTSWTGIGGPLMRTTSAIKFIQSLEVDIDVNKYQTYGEDAKSPENSEHYKARNIPYVSQISPRHFMCNACDSQSKQNSEKCSDNSGANDGDMEAICNCSETRIFGGSESESFSRLEVAEGDLLQPERIHSGIVFNVVKRENITMVNRDYDSGYCPHSPEFIDIDHSRPDSPSKDSYNAETPTDLYCPDKELDFSIHEKKEDPELANDDNLERPACSTAAKHNSECSLDASLKEDSEASISTDFDGLQQNKELSETVTDAGLERTTCSSVNELISEDFNVKAEHPESLPLLESELGTALVINMIGEKRDHHHVDASHTNAFGANVEDICNLDSAVGVQGACSD